MKRLVIFFTLFMSAFQAATQEAKLVLPIGITIEISRLRYSPDGKLILTAESGMKSSSVKIWSAATGKLLSEFTDSSSIAEAQFQSDSKKILVLSHSGMLWTLDAVTARILTVINTSLDVGRARISSDGRMILATSYDSVVRIWNSVTKKIVAQVSLRDDVWDYGFSPGGDKFYVTDMSGLVHVGDLKTNKPVLRLNNTLSKIAFSSDGKKMLLTRNDTVQVWKNGPGLLTLLKEIRSPERIMEAAFSPEGSRIAIATINTIRVHSATNYSFLYELNDRFISAWNRERICFSPDGNKILIQNKETASVRDANSGAILFHLKGEYYHLQFQSFSADGKRILGLPEGTYVPYIWDARNGTHIASLTGHTETISSYAVSRNGNRALLHYWEGPAKLFDATTGQMTNSFEYAKMSPDRTMILAFLKDSTVELLDAETGQTLDTIQALRGPRSFARFSHDGKKILALYGENRIDSSNENERPWEMDMDSLMNNNADDDMFFEKKESIRVWDIEKKILLANLSIGDTSETHKIDISPDQTKLLTGSSADAQVRVWDIRSGKLLHTLDLGDFIDDVQFNPDNRTILTVCSEKPTIWNLNTGKPIREFSSRTFRYVAITNDRRKMLINNVNDETVQIRDVSTGELLKTIKIKSPKIRDFKFSDNGTELVLLTSAETLIFINLETGKETIEPAGNPRFFTPGSVTADGKHFIGTSDNRHKMERWDIRQNKLLFSFFAVDSTDYLVTDDLHHYDGSDDARKLLYFTCGTEIIELDQVKDQLWVPDLAERIMKGDTIRARTLKELNICGLTPEVEDAGSRDDAYIFTIKPRRGSLGETILYINGIETKRYSPTELIRSASGYELRIKKEELDGYFIAGVENLITVKAYTADNAISSRGLKIREDKTKQTPTPPNLYAVMVGVSDYKGNELDLKYAAKDAADMSDAIAAAARKLLNIDGKEHVFMYNLSTIAGETIPEKKSIQRAMEEIGSKATANDILLIFFAGHGVMSSQAVDGINKKQFYFLTADASGASSTGAVADVGISTSELSEWMKPQHIKAQKRILVFDACNSGQAILDFVKLGNDKEGYNAARNDDKTRQIKEIDKLNEKSGLYILSASASDQAAYEMGKYSQGLLTWSLLKALKLQPDILEDGKYLNVGRWFSAAEKTVNEASRESGARQQPQVISTSNFNIGIVDEEVMAKIVLATEKPVVAASIFINRIENDDNLELTKLINAELAAISSRSDSKIVYLSNSQLPTAWYLTGSYEIKGNTVTAIINVKQHKKIIYSFEFAGSPDKPGELVKGIVNKVGEMIK